MSFLSDIGDLFDEFKEIGTELSAIKDDAVKSVKDATLGAQDLVDDTKKAVKQKTTDITRVVTGDKKPDNHQ